MPQDYKKVHVMKSFNVVRSAKDVGDLLKERRVEMDVKQYRLAEVADINRVTLSHIEGGTAEVKISSLLKLADALGMKLALVPVEASVQFEGGLPLADVRESTSSGSLEIEVGEDVDLGALDGFDGEN